MKNKIRRNITLEYIFRFIGNFSITEVIWVLYLAHKGLALTEIGILEGIFHVTSFQVMKGSKKVRKILFFFSYVFTFYTSVFFYCQKYFEEAGLNKVQISLVMLLAEAFSCFGTILSEKLVKRVGENMKYIAAFVMGAAILGMAWGNVILSIGCLAGASFFNAMLYPLQSASLNRLIPSEQRATIISVGSMIFSVFMIVLFPVMGFAADNFGLHVSFLIAGTCEVCSMLLISNKKK